MVELLCDKYRRYLKVLYTKILKLKKEEISEMCDLPQNCKVSLFVSKNNMSRNYEWDKAQLGDSLSHLNPLLVTMVEYFFL